MTQDNRVTQGALDGRTLPGTDEAYFYYPQDGHPDWHEPRVFAVSAMARELDPYVNGGREGLPPGVYIKDIPIDPGMAERLLVTGAVERPLVDEAHRQYWASKGDGSGRLHFMCIHGYDPDGSLRGTLIDGSHSYRAAYERGEKTVLAALMTPAFYDRFCVGGVPYWMVKGALGKGEGDTSRSDYEIATGRRRVG